MGIFFYISQYQYVISQIILSGWQIAINYFYFWINNIVNICASSD